MFEFKNVLPVLAAVTGLGLAAPASAQGLIVTGSTAPAARVSMAGIDLDSVAGQAIAEGRIRSAASGLCHSSAVEPVDVRVARSACYRSALFSGRKQLQRMVAGKGLGSSQAAATAITINAR
jgi:UrcA family protein